MADLTWKKLGKASKITIPTHALFTVTLGVTWFNASTSNSAGLQAISHVWPLRSTAVILIIIGLTEVLMVLIFKGRTAYAVALGMGVLVFLGIAVMSVLGHVTSSSWGSTEVWIYISLLHLASMISLAFYDGVER